jgi:hypothetical protein
MADVVRLLAIEDILFSILMRGIYTLLKVVVLLLQVT